MTPTTEGTVSLYSDTETRPTPGMRAAIAAAEVGDEQKGEDPTIIRLQERVADLLGKEAALWLPTGTMCNLVAVKTHTRPGDALVAEGMAHVIRAESGGAALASGVMVQPIQTDRGIFTPAELEAAMDRVVAVPVPYGQPVGLVCVEQTHNFGGGAVWKPEELRAVSACARGRGVPVHMDGARLLNACVASGVPAAEFAAPVDSLWIDFTKGLGAPIGAVLAGSRDFLAAAPPLQAALRRRHATGGCRRCRMPLRPRHHVDRLAEDHEHARLLARGLAGIDGIAVRAAEPDTNMVFFDVRGLGLSNREFVDRLAASGVRVSGAGGAIRAVTHLDVSRAGIERALSAIEDIASAALR